MSARRLELLQWFGLLAAPCAWALHLVLGVYLAEAHCFAVHWSGQWSGFQIALTSVAALVALAAEAAALAVWRQLQAVDGDAPGPAGRQHFFALAGIVGDVLFFVAIILTGVTVAGAEACRPS